MKALVVFLMLKVAFTLTTVVSAPGQEAPPPWAYPVNGPNSTLDNGTPLRRVPNSGLSMTFAQVRDRFFAPDWHPGDHPPMPEIVARGRKPEVFACAYCHRPDGVGSSENANLTGLPAAYIIQQLADFRSGERKSSVPDRAPIRYKTMVAKAVTDAEVEVAATYFASIKPRSIVRVVEAGTVPKTYVTGWHLALDKAGGNEPIGARIIEVPADLARFVSRDSRLRFTAYVPIGSIQKGRDLATGKNGGKTVPCGVCHGAELNGLGPIPGNRWPVAKLYRSPTVRLQARDPGGSEQRPDEASRGKTCAQRHDLAGGLHGVLTPMSIGFCGIDREFDLVQGQLRRRSKVVINVAAIIIGPAGTDTFR